ncbi:MAG: signal peptidase I [Clostridia bacterium]
MTKTKDSKFTPKQKKIINGVLIAVQAVIIIVCIVFSTFILMAAKNSDDSTTLKASTNLVPVLSDSMTGGKKDSFNKGDMLIVRKIDPASAKGKEMIANLKVGDVVTFWNTGYNALITHRIIELPAEGSQLLKTQGDKATEGNVAQYEFVQISELRGLYQGKIGGIGGVITFLQKPLPFFFLIVIPLLLLLGYNVYVIIKYAMDSKVARMEKDKEEAIAEAKAAIFAAVKSGELKIDGAQTATATATPTTAEQADESQKKDN